jgi:hypothetical protein
MRVILWIKEKHNLRAKYSQGARKRALDKRVGLGGGGGEYRRNMQ